MRLDGSLASLLLPVLAAACATPAPASPAVVTIPVAASAAAPLLVPPPPEPTAAPPPPAIDPPPISGPAAVACMLRAPACSPRGGTLALRFSPKARGPGDAYGALRRGTSAVLRIPVDAASEDPVLDVDAGGVVFRAYVDASAIDLHPARAIVFSEGIVPQPSAIFSFGEGAPDAVQVSLTLPAALGGAVVTRTRPCADLALVTTPFDPLGALGGNGKGRKAALRKASPVTLSSVPGGAQGIEVRPRPNDDLRVTVLEEKKGQARVAWEIGNVVASGWIARALLGPVPEYGMGSIGTIGVGSIGTRSGVVYCDHELRLVVELAGARATVGRIRPGTGISRGANVGDYREVEIVGATVAKAPEARWLVERRAFEGCD